MHYRYLTLFIAFFAVCNMAVAQKQLPQLPDYIIQHNLNRPATSGYHARLIAVATHNDTLLTPARDSTYYTYSAGRGEDGSLQPYTYDSSVIEYFQQGLTGFVAYIKTYNADNLPDTLLAIDSLHYNNAFNFMNRHSFVYDANRRMIADTSQNLLNGVWTMAGTFEHIYGPTGTLTYAASRLYDGASLYYIFSDTFFTYDAAGRLIEFYDRTQEHVYEPTSNLVNFKRVKYKYNTTGALVYTLYEYWNADKQVYDTTDATILQRNSDTSIAVVYDLKYKAPALFDTTAKHFYHYDVNNNLVRIVDSIKFGTNTYFQEDYIHVFTYNTNNDLILSRRLYLDRSTNTYLDLWTPIYYYWESFTPAGVAQLKQQGGKLSIYPVPAANTLNIDVSWQVKQNYTMLVADMQGRVLVYDSNKSSLNISALPPGNYNLVLKGDKGAVLHRQFVVAH
jgi:hypothetical protein